MKQEISNSEFGLTKSKITPIQTKTPKKLVDILPGKDDNSVSKIVHLVEKSALKKVLM